MMFFDRRKKEKIFVNTVGYQSRKRKRKINYDSRYFPKTVTSNQGQNALEFRNRSTKSKYSIT